EENRAMSIDDARQSGAMMLFGEKYGEKVRVIKFGGSVELCGGTHADATGQIGLLKIVSESAVAAGIRRIEAITAERAEKYINDQLDLLEQIKEAIKGSKDVLTGVASLLQQNNDLSKQLEAFQRESLKIAKSNLKSKVLMEQGVNIIAELIELDNAALIKDLAYQLRGEVENLFLVLGAEVDGKPLLTVMIADNIVAEKGLHAGNIIREAAKLMQGGGGGQPFYATAGGKDVDGLQAAVEKACSFLN
ncbi:MAG: DHHA1 domain-containing protein, partial [Mangrovibacterium sp.]